MCKFMFKSCYYQWENVNQSIIKFQFSLIFIGIRNNIYIWLTSEFAKCTTTPTPPPPIFFLSTLMIMVLTQPWIILTQSLFLFQILLVLTLGLNYTHTHHTRFNISKIAMKFSKWLKNRKNFNIKKIKIFP